jgi:hypothetical protein
MDKLFAADTNIQNEIEAKTSVYIEAHDLIKSQLILKEKDKYIHVKSYELFEKKMFEELTDGGKARDPYVRFIKEKVENVYLDYHRKKIDKDTILTMNLLYPHFRRWFNKNYPTLPQHIYAKSRASFLVPGRLGPFTVEGKEAWIGMKIKV